MKAKIVRKEEVNGDFYFHVFADEKLVKAYYFQENKPEDSAMNEEKNFDAAMKMAKKIESVDSVEKITVIYETPS